LALIAGVAVAALVLATTLTAVAMSRGGWDMDGWGMMGSGHMNGMMGGGVNSSNAPLSVGTSSESVAMRDFAFTPGNLQVPVGATVTWTNYDTAPHTATAKDGSWDTGTLTNGDTKTLTFDKAGDYAYYCRFHPNMVARLTVK